MLSALARNEFSLTELTPVICVVKKVREKTRQTVVFDNSGQRMQSCGI